MAINNEDRYRTYSQKTLAWPEEAGFYLGSDSLAVNQQRLADMYHVSTADLAELLIDLVLADFDFAQLESLAQERLKISALVAKDFADYYIAYVLLPLDEYYPELKIKAEAEKRQIDIAKFQPFIEAFRGEITDELLDAVDKFSAFYTDNDPQEEANATLGIIKNSLAELLKNGSREMIESLNNSLLFILNNDIKNRDKILQLLMADKTRLTEKSLLIHDKPEEPTVANWLSDFLYRAQNKIADTLTLTEYMTGSVNCRRLSDDERRAVQNLFEFYRNLKLYPEIFKDTELDQWQIFPLPPEAKSSPATAAAMKPAAKAASDATTAPAKSASAGKADLLQQYDWSAISGLERRALMEELGISKQELDAYLKTVK